VGHRQGLSLLQQAKQKAGASPCLSGKRRGPNLPLQPHQDLRVVPAHHAPSYVAFDISANTFVHGVARAGDGTARSSDFGLESARPAPSSRSSRSSYARPPRVTDVGGTFFVWAAAGEELVLELLAIHSQRKDSRHHKAFDGLLRYLRTSTHRTDYRRYRARGFQIGSGAMESLHRTASQLRLKVWAAVQDAPATAARVPPLEQAPGGSVRTADTPHKRLGATRAV
jgi:hypothetical protein